MKRGTPSHPKTLALAAALELPQWGAVGLLEMLWHFAAQYARRGDVGRHGDGAIAAALGWTQDPARLVQVLVETGWLDGCSCHRLRIHDWPEHADQAVQRTEDVRRRGFLECYQRVELLRGTAFAKPASRPLETSSSLLEVSSLPLPLPEPEPTDPPLTPPASGGDASAPARADVCGPEPARRAGGNGAGAAAAPVSPERRQRARQLRADADAAERYWIQLGGRPGPTERRQMREALRTGHALDQVLGSIGERVRDELVARGALGSADPWPPPGLAPFDPRPALPPARASPTAGEEAAAREAWERVSQALQPRLSTQAWATWIRPCRGRYVREGRLVVDVPNAQFLDWIGRNWSAQLQWAAAESGVEGVDLVVASAPAIAG